MDVARGNRLEIQADVVKPWNHTVQVLHGVVHRVQRVVGKGRVARMADNTKVLILAHARRVSQGGTTRRPRRRVVIVVVAVTTMHRAISVDVMVVVSH